MKSTYSILGLRCIVPLDRLPVTNRRALLCYAWLNQRVCYSANRSPCAAQELRPLYCRHRFRIAIP